MTKEKVPLDTKQKSLYQFFVPVAKKIDDLLDQNSDDAGTSIEITDQAAEEKQISPIKVLEVEKEHQTNQEGPIQIDQNNDGLTNYELERLERIKRNKEVMKSLGLGNGGYASVPLALSNNNTTTQSRKRRPASSANTRTDAAPIRRSTRHCRLSSAHNDDVTTSIVIKSKATVDEIHTSPLNFDNSSVEQYICNTRSSNTPSTNTIVDIVKSSSNQDIPDDTSFIKGFTISPLSFYDQNLAKIYSIDHQSGLLAAGGKDGRIAIWGSLHCPNNNNNNRDEEEDDDSNVIMPLLSQKLHTGWISDVQLWTDTTSSTLLKDYSSTITSGSSGDNNDRYRLFTASNDGSLSLWDITKSAILHNNKGTIPQRIVHATDLHSIGIFSMHCAYTNNNHNNSSSSGSKEMPRIVTSSKDGSVLFSRIHEDSTLHKISRYDNLHEGLVVKCVKWSPFIADGGVVFASCGNDGAVKIQDTRIHTTTNTQRGNSIEFRGQHSTAVNCVRWSPLDQHILLSTSFDPCIVVHDTRMPSDVPLHTLQGHFSGSNRIKSMYQPSFVWNGEAIATGGEGANSSISLYRVSDGSTISRGRVDAALGATFCSCESKMDVLLSNVHRNITIFSPRLV